MIRGNSIYLQMAALAATAGFMSIGFSIGMPLWNSAHGIRQVPVFFLFSIWGMVALMGAAANLYVYRLTTPPSRPPRGGHRIAEVTHLDTRRTAATDDLRKAA